MDATGTPEPGPNVPKLRTSCDSCLNVKVKCEKTGTACRRCTALGRSCQYSPSKRRGKPPASAREAARVERENQMADAISNSGPRSSISMESRRGNSPAESMHSAQIIEDLEMLQRMDSMNAPQYQDTTMSDKPVSPNDPSNHSAVFTGSGYKSPTAPTPDLGRGWDFVKSVYPSDNFQWTEHLQNFQSPPVGLTPCPASQSPNSFTTLNDCTHQPQDCASLALNALNSLYPCVDARDEFVFSSYPFSPQRGAAEFGNPLGVHAWVVETVQQILRCRCSLEEDVALSCMAIVYRVLSFFNGPVSPNASATSTSPSASAPASRSGNSSSSSPSSMPSQAGSTTPQPKWETDTEFVMQRVSILQEMRRVAQYLDSLAERRSTAGQVEGMNEIFSMLSKSLRSRLSTAMRDVADMSSSLAMTYA